MIALDFNDPIPDGATRSAFLFKLLCQLFEFRRIEGHPGYQADPAALTTLGLATDPHHAVSGRPAFLSAAAALLDRMTATRAGSTDTSCIDQSSLFCFLHQTCFPFLLFPFTAFSFLPRPYHTFPGFTTAGRQYFFTL